MVKSSFPDSFADCIVTLNVLEHIESDIAALNQIRRMLKKGGIAIIEVPAGPALYDSFDFSVGHYRRYTMRELETKINKANMRILSKSHLGFVTYPAFWLLKKKNQLVSRYSASPKEKIVLKTIRTGRSSNALHHLFSFERKLRNSFYLPIGARCLVTAIAE